VFPLSLSLCQINKNFKKKKKEKRKLRSLSSVISGFTIIS